MVAGAGAEARLEHVGERRSRNGTYVALRVRILVAEAAQVLDVYEVLKQLDHVFATL